MMETQNLLPQLGFWLFAGMMLLGALGVVLQRSIVYSALFLLIAFLSIAGTFVLLNAPFLAATQILVYGVGLTIVLIFGIMLTGDQPFEDAVGYERPKRYFIIPGIVAAGVVGFMLWALLQPASLALKTFNPLIKATGLSPEATSAGAQAITVDGGLSHIATLLFSQYLVPFELASILLLLAMIGAIILSIKALPEEEGEPEISQTALYPQPESSGTLEQPALSKKETLGVH